MKFYNQDEYHSSLLMEQDSESQVKSEPQLSTKQGMPLCTEDGEETNQFHNSTMEIEQKMDLVDLTKSNNNSGVIQMPLESSIESDRALMAKEDPITVTDVNIASQNEEITTMQKCSTSEIPPPEMAELEHEDASKEVAETVNSITQESCSEDNKKEEKFEDSFREVQSESILLSKRHTDGMLTENETGEVESLIDSSNTETKEKDNLVVYENTAAIYVPLQSSIADSDRELLEKEDSETRKDVNVASEEEKITTMKRRPTDETPQPGMEEFEYKAASKAMAETETSLTQEGCFEDDGKEAKVEDSAREIQTESVLLSNRPMEGMPPDSENPEVESQIDTSNTEIKQKDDLVIYENTVAIHVPLESSIAESDRELWAKEDPKRGKDVNIASEKEEIKTMQKGPADENPLPEMEELEHEDASKAEEEAVSSVTQESCFKDNEKEEKAEDSAREVPCESVLLSKRPTEGMLTDIESGEVKSQIDCLNTDIKQNHDPIVHANTMAIHMPLECSIAESDRELMEKEDPKTGKDVNFASEAGETTTTQKGPTDETPQPGLQELEHEDASKAVAETANTITHEGNEDDEKEENVEETAGEVKSESVLHDNRPMEGIPPDSESREVESQIHSSNTEIKQKNYENTVAIDVPLESSIVESDRELMAKEDPKTGKDVNIQSENEEITRMQKGQTDATPQPEMVELEYEDASKAAAETVKSITQESCSEDDEKGEKGDDSGKEVQSESVLFSKRHTEGISTDSETGEIESQNDSSNTEIKQKDDLVVHKNTVAIHVLLESSIAGSDREVMGKEDLKTGKEVNILSEEEENTTMQKGPTDETPQPEMEELEHEDASNAVAETARCIAQEGSFEDDEKEEKVKDSAGKVQSESVLSSKPTEEMSTDSERRELESQIDPEVYENIVAIHVPKSSIAESKKDISATEDSKTGKDVNIASEKDEISTMQKCPTSENPLPEMAELEHEDASKAVAETVSIVTQEICFEDKEKKEKVEESAREVQSESVLGKSTEGMSMDSEIVEVESQIDCSNTDIKQKDDPVVRENTVVSHVPGESSTAESARELLEKEDPKTGKVVNFASEEEELTMMQKGPTDETTQPEMEEFEHEDASKAVAETMSTITQEGFYKKDEKEEEVEDSVTEVQSESVLLNKRPTEEVLPDCESREVASQIDCSNGETKEKDDLIVQKNTMAIPVALESSISESDGELVGKEDTKTGKDVNITSEEDETTKKQKGPTDETPQQEMDEFGHEDVSEAVAKTVSSITQESCFKDDKKEEKVEDSAGEVQRESVLSKRSMEGMSTDSESREVASQTDCSNREIKLKDDLVVCENTLAIHVPLESSIAESDGDLMAKGDPKIGMDVNITSEEEITTMQKAEMVELECEDASKVVAETVSPITQESCLEDDEKEEKVEDSLRQAQSESVLLEKRAMEEVLLDSESQVASQTDSSNGEIKQKDDPIVYKGTMALHMPLESSIAVPERELMAKDPMTGTAINIGKEEEEITTMQKGPTDEIPQPKMEELEHEDASKLVAETASSITQESCFENEEKDKNVEDSARDVQSESLLLGKRPTEGVLPDGESREVVSQLDSSNEETKQKDYTVYQDTVAIHLQLESSIAVSDWELTAKEDLITGTNVNVASEEEEISKMQKGPTNETCLPEMEELEHENKDVAKEVRSVQQESSFKHDIKEEKIEDTAEEDQSESLLLGKRPTEGMLPDSESSEITCQIDCADREIEPKDHLEVVKDTPSIHMPHESSIAVSKMEIVAKEDTKTGVDDMIASEDKEMTIMKKCPTDEALQPEMEELERENEAVPKAVSSMPQENNFKDENKKVEDSAREVQSESLLSNRPSEGMLSDSESTEVTSQIDSSNTEMEPKDDLVVVKDSAAIHLPIQSSIVVSDMEIAKEDSKAGTDAKIESGDEEMTIIKKIATDEIFKPEMEELEPENEDVAKEVIPQESSFKDDKKVEDSTREVQSESLLLGKRPTEGMLLDSESRGITSQIDSSNKEIEPKDDLEVVKDTASIHMPLESSFAASDMEIMEEKDPKAGIETSIASEDEEMPIMNKSPTDETLQPELEELEPENRAVAKAVSSMPQESCFKDDKKEVEVEDSKEVQSEQLLNKRPAEGIFPDSESREVASQIDSSNQVMEQKGEMVVLTATASIHVPLESSTAVPDMEIMEKKDPRTGADSMIGSGDEEMKILQSCPTDKTHQPGMEELEPGNEAVAKAVRSIPQESSMKEDKKEEKVQDSDEVQSEQLLSKRPTERMFPDSQKDDLTGLLESGSIKMPFDSSTLVSDMDIMEKDPKTGTDAKIASTYEDMSIMQKGQADEKLKPEEALKVVTKEVSSITQEEEKDKESAREIQNEPHLNKIPTEGMLHGSEHEEAKELTPTEGMLPESQQREAKEKPVKSTLEEASMTSLHDLLHLSRNEKSEVARDFKIETEQIIQSDETKDGVAGCDKRNSDEDKDEEVEEGTKREEEAEAEAAYDSPVMVEASRDAHVKVTHKKSHNILSGVGSKVKHSIAKVKKVIAGKSSHPKASSPK